MNLYHGKMLTVALKSPNNGSLQDVMKQFIIWALSKKREFSSVKNSNFYSLDEEEHDDGDRFSRRKFTPRPRYNKYQNNNNFYDRGFRGNRWNNSNYRNDRFRQKEMDETFLWSKADFNFKSELKPYIKDFYNPHPDVVNRSADAIKEFYQNYSIKLFGNKQNECPPPIFDFKELNLSDKELSLIRNLNYTTPTPVQSVTWPIALSGYNMVGVSRTGSGKTLGFVLPAMIHIRHQVPLDSKEGPVVLIVSPTRELGQQIMRVVQPFSNTFSFRAASFFGGSGKEQQLREFRNGAEICVATPGRLLDVMNDGFLNLSRCTYMVLDEADRLLDMGFSPQIESVMKRSRNDKQVLMWSATWPEEVYRLAETYLKDYIAVKFGSTKLEANPDITQITHICEENEKPALLQRILSEINKSPNKKTLIFAKTKLRVDKIGQFLRNKGFKVLTIHGDKSQKHRDTSIRFFRAGNVDILVGTLVVGRGLDINNIGNVILFDFPSNLEDYVHMIGRTGRAGNSGTAHSFFTSAESSLARGLVKILESSNQEICPELKDLVRYRNAGNASNS